jgi:hypothetical protein
MKLSTRSLRKSYVAIFSRWKIDAQTLLERSILLLLSVLAVAVSGCTFPPSVMGESSLGVTPHKFKTVILLLSPGVFENLRTFDKIHIEHLGDVIGQELKNKGVKTDVVLIRQTDLDYSALHQAVQRLRPSHIVRVMATKRTTSTNLDMVTWAVQVDQEEPSKGEFRYVTGFKFTIVGDGCVKYKTWSSLEKELSCFQELSIPILSKLHQKGF